MTYNEYKYLWPPRPTQCISPDQLDKYDNDTYIGQPKYDGSCCVVFLDGKDFIKIMNRHGEEMTEPFHSEIDYKGLHQGNGFMVLCGELLNKNKTREEGQPFNKKLVLWDILVYEGEYLIGTTVDQRLALLEKLYPCSMMRVTPTELEIQQAICCTSVDGVYKAPSYTGNFYQMYQRLTTAQLFEGVVLKRADAKLTFGFNEVNNNSYMLKCRRKTLNYNF